MGGDWSNAAFWLCAAALGNPVRVTGVNPDSVQGDRAVLGALALLGARVSRQPGAVDVTPDDPRGTRLDVRSCLETVCACVNALGGSCSTAEDGLVIQGVESLAGGTVDAANDHRIAMMAAIMATRCGGPVTILGAQCVAKSYPAFFEDYASLGGNVTKEA